MTDLTCDILVVGGGLGGVAAALAALRTGKTVVLTEEYDWLGGQLTSQAVPLDEHTWVEQFGVTASYRRMRDAIRDYYRTWYPLTEQARAQRDLNPGAGLVSNNPEELLAAARLLLAEPERARACGVAALSNPSNSPPIKTAARRRRFIGGELGIRTLGSFRNHQFSRLAP